MAKYIIFTEDKEGFRTVIATTTSKNKMDAQKYAVKMYMGRLNLLEEGKRLGVMRAS